MERAKVCNVVAYARASYAAHFTFLSISEANGVGKNTVQRIFNRKIHWFSTFASSCWFIYSFDAKATIQNSLTSTCVWVCFFSSPSSDPLPEQFANYFIYFPTMFSFSGDCEHKHYVLVYRKTRLKRNLRYKMIRQTTKGKRRRKREKETNVQT